jgi:hypothetical protein
MQRATSAWSSATGSVLSNVKHWTHQPEVISIVERGAMLIRLLGQVATLLQAASLARLDALLPSVLDRAFRGEL